MRKFAHLLLIAGIVAGLASAGVIDTNTGGTVVSPTAAFFGQSFTTPGGGPFDDITFNFYADAGSTTPTAAGTAFLLSQVFLGAPADLNTSTPGFLGASTSISAGRYIFAPSLVLQANTKYFLYENAAMVVSGGNTIPTGEGYFLFPQSQTTFAPAPFADGSGNVIPGEFQATNFTVTADAVVTAVPEPATFGLLLVFGVGGIATRLRRARG
jgi:hypothetical protein